MAGDRDDPEELLATFHAQMAALEEPKVPEAESAEEIVENPRERAAKIADPRFMSLVENRVRHDLVRTTAPLTYLREPTLHLDPQAWRTGFLEVHEHPAASQMNELMHEPVPQALLRDLFRPPFSEPRQYARMELPLDPGGRQAFALIAEAKHRETVVAAGESIADSLEKQRRAWREFLETPWQPHLADDQPRREVFVVTEPSMNY